MSQEVSSPDRPFYILCVDDEAEFLEVLTDLLSTSPYKIKGCNSVAEAKGFLKDHHKQTVLIISDYNMPDTNGLEFRSQILEAYKDIPFAILSGFVDKEMALKAVDLKIVAFLNKPVSNNELNDLLAKEGTPRFNTLKEEAELLAGFVEEARANLDQVEPLILNLEANPTDIDAINRIFGFVHTLKGASGYFEPQTLHKFVHKFEDLINKLKTGAQPVIPTVITALLKGLDILYKLVGELKTGQHTLTDLDALLAAIQVDTSQAAPQASGPAAQGPATGAHADGQKAAAATATVDEEIKVPVAVLDDFVKQSGELTVLRYMANEIYKVLEKRYRGDKDFVFFGQLLDEMHKINVNVQAKTVALRKVSFKSVVRTFQRLVRDLGGSLKKDIKFVVSGEDLRFDASIGRVLSQALVHMIRNSCDHGIESCEARESAGKPKQGTLILRAFEKSDKIFIQLEDDGAGIDSERVRQKLIKNAQLPIDVIQKMTEQELVYQIFEPGFSTAAQVTTVSGRGVGMDMVKKSVEGVNGRVLIDTKVGRGTVFTLEMPVPKSTVIIDTLMVSAGQQTFGIAQDCILRIYRVTDQGHGLIDQVEGGRTIRYEGMILPIVQLVDVLGIRSSAGIKEEQILIIKTPNGLLYGLSVDEVMDIADSVIKEVPDFVKKFGAYGGATFLGNGTIALILNLDGLAEICKLQKANRKVKNADLQSEDSGGERQDLVIFKLSNSQSLFAVSQKAIYRIENLNIRQASKAGGSWVLPYGDQILQIVDMNAVLNGASAQEWESQKPTTALVVKSDGMMKGFVIDSVCDIASVRSKIDDTIKGHEAISGTVLVDNKTVTVIDLQQLKQAA